MDRIVVLDSERAMEFLARASLALADAANDVRVARSSDDELVEVYAEVLGAQARILLRQFRDVPEHEVWCKRIQHLLMRAEETHDGESGHRLVDIADQLHGLLVQVYAAP